MLAGQVAQDSETESAGQRRNFADQQGWAGARIEALPADASFRRYFRLHGGPKPALLMDCSRDPEPIEDFIRIARHLRKLGVHAPEIYAEDMVQRYAIIEDFGDEVYAHMLDAGQDVRVPYENATDVLIRLHKNPGNAKIDLGRYDEKQFLDREASLLVDWYLPAAIGRAPTKTERDDYFGIWRLLFESVDTGPEVMVMRDYHSPNLMRLAGRSGVESCGVLDFQIGLIGSAAYDLMSLLQDARRKLPAGLADAMLERYLKARPELDREAYISGYHIWAAQRHAKVLGIFVRLNLRDKKPKYLQYIPHVAQMMQNSLQAPVLAPLKAWAGKAGIDLSRSLPAALDPKAGFPL